MLRASVQPYIRFEIRDFFEQYTERPVFAWIQSQIPDHLTPEEYRQTVESLDGEVETLYECSRIDRLSESDC